MHYGRMHTSLSTEDKWNSSLILLASFTSAVALLLFLFIFIPYLCLPVIGYTFNNVFAKDLRGQEREG